MSSMTVRWSELGSPTTPGTHRVPGIGDVDVEQDDIDRAVELGGDPRVEIVESTTFQSSVRTYVLGHFIP